MHFKFSPFVWDWRFGREQRGFDVSTIYRGIWYPSGTFWKIVWVGPLTIYWRSDEVQIRDNEA